MSVFNDSVMAYLKQELHDRVRNVAAETGTNPDIIYKWLRDERSPSLKMLSPIMDYLKVEPHFPDKALSEFDFVAKVKAKAGAGASLEVSDEVSGYYAFRQDFMGRLNLHAKKCVLMDVIGDSMTPTIADGDTVLIDQSDKELRDRQIYVVTLFDELRIKRLQKTFDGIDLVSDNRAIEPIHVRGEDIDRLVIHGRVRWVGKCL